jgi:hypothetical protein
MSYRYVYKYKYRAYFVMGYSWVIHNKISFVFVFVNVSVRHTPNSIDYNFVATNNYIDQLICTISCTYSS